ncbi:MAG: hypothetical protein IBX64_11315 [Actinobacteria bacterium]|nr:hypothetical protein [Actinomycetota bacterium]
MLLTITNNQKPATDLGYLLHKNPANVQSFDLPFGNVHVFYPEATDERCTAAVLLDIDPIALAKSRRRSVPEGPMSQYINDRPYIASSFLSVAISRVLGSALAGRSKERQELADSTLPLEATLAVVPCRGGEDLLQRIFEPLGYEVVAERHILDEQLQGWGYSDYFTLTLSAHCRLKDLLTHLYVLIPVLDEEKHYWVGADEVEKLLRFGSTWLPSHP